MPHLDDGRLHEYLDAERAGGNGAAAAVFRRQVEEHLQHCAECRARLDRARETRVRAGAILSEAAPVAVSRPPFGEISARARPAAASGSAHGTPYRLVAAAAVIAMVLGAGWLGRDLLRSPTPATQTAVTHPAAPDHALAKAYEPPTAPPPTAAATTKPPELVRSGTPPTAPSPPRVASGAGTPAENPNTGTTMGNATAARAKAEVSAEAQAIAADRADLRADARLDTSGAVPGSNLTSEWRMMSASAAAGAVGGKLWLVAGLPTVDYAAARLPDGITVRTTQLLADDRMLELLQRRPTAADTALPVPNAPMPALDRTQAAPELTVMRGGFLIRLRARVSPDSLRALATRLH